MVSFPHSLLRATPGFTKVQQRSFTSNICELRGSKSRNQGSKTALRKKKNAAKKTGGRNMFGNPTQAQFVQRKVSNLRIHHLLVSKKFGKVDWIDDVSIDDEGSLRFFEWKCHSQKSQSFSPASKESPTSMIFLLLHKPPVPNRGFLKILNCI